VISGEYCVFHNEIADSFGFCNSLATRLVYRSARSEFSPGLP
jgi:hypothetical protein